ncbi:antA/AntB antirepressor family protein [Alkalicoccus chagannorensis]|uniref:antA/AntB antirepressor family protein n=1 Tax=Alkalicoccus chagannorensis TaxID=427072 RepID=UPI0003F8E12A|nr:antA/AntB antirepressor family protein [Alkalicoccus chagannorensis]
MTELINTFSGDNKEDILVSGRELHEFMEVGTRYDNWFKRMADYGFEENVDFIPVVQKWTTAQGNETTSTDHHLKLDMGKEIAMLQRTEKGKQARQYFIEVEKRWNNPEMVIQRALQYQQQKIEALESEKQQNLPYTRFGQQVSNSDASINIGAFAKMIYDKHGVSIGRNKLFQWFRENGYFIKHGREKNNPKQKYIEQGLFSVSPTVISRSHGDVESFTTLISGKGQVKFTNILLEEFAVNK